MHEVCHGGIALRCCTQVAPRALGAQLDAVGGWGRVAGFHGAGGAETIELPDTVAVGLLRARSPRRAARPLVLFDLKFTGLTFTPDPLSYAVALASETTMRPNPR